MIIEYEGQRYPFDFDDIGVKQGIAIEHHTGLPFAEWGAALEKGGNLLALQAVGWLILTGGDLAAPIGDCNFAMVKLGTAFAKAVAAEAEAQEAALPGPTAAAVSVPAPAAPEANGSAEAAGPLSGSVSALT